MSLKSLPFLLAGVLSLSSAEAEAAVLVVDCAAGPWTTIQAAVAAAAPGDTVAVRPCATGFYAPFNIGSKTRVHVVGADTVQASGGYNAGFGNNPAVLNPPVVVDGRSALGTSCVTITASAEVEVHGLKLQNCSMHGVDVQGSFGTLLQGNRIFRAGSEGVLVQPDCENVRIVNNVIANSGANGVLLLDTYHSLILDNQIGFNGQNGILLPTPVDRNTVIANNEIRLNALAGIEVNGMETRIERNTLLGNLRLGGLAELVVGPPATSPDLIGNNTGGLSIADLSGTADMYGNR